MIFYCFAPTCHAIINTISKGNPMRRVTETVEQIHRKRRGFLIEEGTISLVGLMRIVRLLLGLAS